MASHSSGLRVLIFDNDGDTADTCRTLVPLWDHEARAAYSGTAALEVAAAWSPDVVLIDIGMPGMNGHQLCRELRQQSGLARTQLFAVTGYTDRDNQRRADDAGFALMLTKPVDPEWLRRLLDRVNVLRMSGLAPTSTWNMEGSTMNDHHPLSQTSIHYCLFWDHRWGKELVVEVENLTRTTIRRLYVLWQYKGETPLVPQAELNLTMAELQEAGGNTILEPQEAGEQSALSADLAPGSGYQFIARGGTVGQMLSRMSALGPEQYSIGFQSQGVEFARLPGSELATFLAQPVCADSGA